jgi:7-keto-8-aminopelargonate synthetase-like enzyme
MEKSMQPGRAFSDGNRPSGHFRNTAYVIKESRAHFDAAHAAGLMEVHGRSTSGRAFAVGTGRLDDRPQAIDFLRCSYLGLDNHPVIVAGAIEAIEAHRSLRWSCARTRLNFDLLAELEVTLPEMFCARMPAFSTVMLANLGRCPSLLRSTDGRKEAGCGFRSSCAHLARLSQADGG